MRILGIEATLEVRLVVYEEEKIQILEDMYMLDHVCVPDIKRKEVLPLKASEPFKMQDRRRTDTSGTKRQYSSDLLL